ncbi:MAG: thiolase C-terminal domain-containing protein [Sphingobium sp.]
MANLLKDKTAIVGLGETRVGKLLVETEEELACQAIKTALDEAGIDPSEVDALCSFSIETTDEEKIARDLGMGDIRFFAESPSGGGGGCATVGYAAMAIATGQAEVAVAWRSRKRSARAQRTWMQTHERVNDHMMWTRPWGIIRPADELALFYQRYMHEFGATREHLANVAIACRRHANNNPNALMHGKPMDRDIYFSGRFISDPLSLYDCCLETDLAQAVVLVSADRAKDVPTKPVYLHAFGQGVNAQSSMLASCYAPDPLHTTGYVCAETLFRDSDFQPAQVDVAQLYDSFTPWVLHQLESYGFCKRGEGAAFSENGGLEIGGRLPVNTAGGSLSDGYSHGYNHIIEGVRQMRGDSTNQVKDAKSCLVTSSDGAPTSAILLRAA